MKRLTAMAALSGLLLLVPPLKTHAACEGSQRISVDRARCLVTELSNAK